MTKGSMFKSAFGLAVAVLMTASLSFARFWGGHESSVKSTRITIASNMTLANGKVLKAGTYLVEVPIDAKAPEVKFDRAGKTVAEAQAKVVTENQKNPYTEVESSKQGNDNVMTAIAPGGWSEKLVFD